MKLNYSYFPYLYLFKLSIGTIAVFLLFTQKTHAQALNIDSLKRKLTALPLDTNRVNTLNYLAEELRIVRRDSACLPYAEKAYKLARKLNYDKGMGKAKYEIGAFMSQTGEMKAALQQFDIARKHFLKSGHKGMLAYIYNNIGASYLRLSEYGKAIGNFKEALNLNKAIDNKRQIAHNLANIGNCYVNFGEYSTALDYYFQALAINEDLEAREEIAADYNSIAIVFNKQGDSQKSIEYHQKALVIYRELGNDYGVGSSLTNIAIPYKDLQQLGNARTALQEALQIFNEQKYDYAIMYVLHNLGTVYYEEGKYDLALRNMKAAQRIARETGGKKNMLLNYEELAEIYLKINKKDSALISALKGLKLAETINARENIPQFHLILSGIYKESKDYERALLFLEKHLIYKDSLFNEDKSRQIEALKTRYETRQKEQKIALLANQSALQRNEIERKSLLQKVLFATFAFTVILGVVIFRNNKARQKSKRLLLSEQLKLEKVEAERLQELDQMKSRFFANIAHEFRTPLTLILGPLENLVDTIKNHSYRNQLLLIKRNASTLLRLINQLLDLSKLEAGAMKVEKCQEDLLLFLKGVTYSFQSLSEQQNIGLTFHTELEGLTMAFDQDKTEKIMANLLSNAFKFTPGSGQIDVMVARVREDFIKVTVTNTGTVIPEDQIAHLFNRFYRADNAQAYQVEGSGIGLALTKELVEIQGGYIAVRSQPEIGTEFYFTLPIEGWVTETVAPLPVTVINSKESTPEIAAEKPRPVVGAGSADSTSEIILVIEDNVEVRQFICSTLKDRYHLLEASDGGEGVAMALEHVPDLIISDVMMPEKDGYTVCRELKSDEKTSHIPVVLLTAKAGMESKLKGLETGADDYLPKPFHSKELLQRIRNLITVREQLRKKYSDNFTGEEKSDFPAIENAFLKKIRGIIEEHLNDEAFGVEDLSRSAGMSRTQLHRKLKALTDQSASLFIRAVRLEHAIILLKEKNNNVSEVAYQVGFSTPAYFSTCFTEHFGYPPSKVVET